ncbi:MAG: 3'(2'),5'-bisphosphate nucleotidase CysQ [Acidiferrobacterales bacterium]|nr:3'(2'),5'-bisphosphate nucleotidase CysQ [Acidiferrobacterales bacterium]
MPSSEPPDPERLIDDVVQLSIEAGQEILQHYQTDYSVEYKSNNTPVTIADVRANGIIVSGLKHLEPSIPIISEESPLPDYEERSMWSCYWLVDPLDGTKSFVRQEDEFTVNIALVDGASVILGVVHSPCENRTYWGVSGNGAHCLDSENDVVRKISVRNCSEGRATVITPRSRGFEKSKVFIDHLASESIECDVVRASSSIKFCRVAEGVADVFPSFTNTCEWDTAAAQCVLECAGGKVVDPAGNTVVYNKPDMLNPNFLASGDADIDWTRFV